MMTHVHPQPERWIGGLVTADYDELEIPVPA